MTHVDEQIEQGYEPLGAPFLGEEMMYQALLKRTDPKLPTT